MRETEYVELAFWAGWVEALGRSLSHDELIAMDAALRDRLAAMVQDYLDYEAADATD